MSRSEFSPVVAELVAMLGKRKAFALCRAGDVVYVPVTLNSRARLLQMLGAVDAAKLIARWGGQQLQLPNLIAIDKGRRNAEIRLSVANGAKVKEVARQHGLSVRQVRNVLRAEIPQEEIYSTKEFNSGQIHTRGVL